MTKLKSNVTDALKSRSAFVDSVDASVVKTLIKTTIADIDATLSVIPALAEQKLASGISKFINDNSTPMVSNYKDMIKHLPSQLKNNELANPFSGLISGLEKFKLILSEMDGKIDDYFLNKEINLFNTKMTHIIILSSINYATVLNKYTGFITTGVLQEMSGGDAVTKYRVEYTKAGEKFAAIVSHINGKTVKFTDLAKLIKQHGMDINIVTESGEPNVLIDTSSTK